MRVRRLDELGSTGDVRWFQPALDRRASLANEADASVRAFFDGVESPLIIARAPGRLDVMGGIADYSGATVLQLPLDRATFATLARQRAPRCDIVSRRGGAWSTCTVDLAPVVTGSLATPDALASHFKSPEDHWAAYVVGAVQFCLQRAEHWLEMPQPGVRILIESTVPEGKGVSSSAAIEVAVMGAVAAAFNVEMSASEVATACQWVENHIVGAPCGIMDQMTSACGQRDRLLRLRCQPGTIEDQLEIPKGYRLVGIDSGLRHAVTGADYSTVRTATFMGYRMIADYAHFSETVDGDRVQVHDPQWHGYLANITPSEFANAFAPRLPVSISGREFLEQYGGTTDSVTRVDPERTYRVRVATGHPVYEQDRVVRFADLLFRLANDPLVAAEMGVLMIASHKSYSACGLGSDGTDRLVELVAHAGPARGCYGAKITGGGSGGTVAVLAREDAMPTIRQIAADYATETGRPIEIFEGSGPGAAELGVLVLP